ncbi:hypothetical protein Micbo1qcDRAFT_20478 [Microdochium bolleyi]|uniref:Uncharacterized protein n=1 Tax=Microdochium bolleyi TaxID=196109 RepID=A0A136IT06_9PEZI|nr:hypothetical protein Micbo1qcDRAFT_20478 [Microdochium bolleyi]
MGLTPVDAVSWAAAPDTHANNLASPVATESSNTSETERGIDHQSASWPCLPVQHSPPSSARAARRSSAGTSSRTTKANATGSRCHVASTETSAARADAASTTSQTWSNTMRASTRGSQDESGRSGHLRPETSKFDLLESRINERIPERAGCSVGGRFDDRIGSINMMICRPSSGSVSEPSSNWRRHKDHYSRCWSGRTHCRFCCYYRCGGSPLNLFFCLGFFWLFWPRRKPP